VSEPDNRRPLKTRGKAWAQRLAAEIAKGQVSPDLISLMSVGFALIGGASLAISGLSFGIARVVLLLLAALAIQLRLLCNMLDGMVAVEHGRGGPFGPIWNEVPDRIADTLLLAGAGYGAIHADRDLGPAVGWLCASLALMTAYVRELGRSLGFAADFSGPMAKPHRMFVLTLACLVSLSESLWSGQGRTLFWALGLIGILTALTIARRIRRLATALKAKAKQG
jgi:phosphatidylglycerophosphate synthase